MKHVKIIALSAVFLGLPVGFAGAQENATFYISPNNDGTKDKLVIPFSVTDSRFIKSWHFIVTDASGKEVYRKGDALPEVTVKPGNVKEILAAFFKPKESVPVPRNVQWEGNNAAGNRLPDGSYFFYFSASDDNNNYGETRRFRLVIDTVPPAITVRQPADAEKTFGQAAKPALTIQQSGSREDLWIGEIRDANDKIVRSFEWRDASPPNLVWDGTDNQGFSVADGVYSYSARSTDAAGNKSPPVLVSAITYDSTPKDAEVGRAFAELAPNGKTKTQTFSIKASEPNRIESWSFQIVPAGKPNAEPVAKWPRGGEKIPQRIEWNGKGPDGGVIEGSFIGKLDITYASGSAVQTQTQPFVSGNTPVAAVTTAPEHFSPDGDGSNDVLNIKLDVKHTIPVAEWHFVIYEPNGKPFWTASGKSEIPAQLTWNGRGTGGDSVESAIDYPYSLTLTDTQEQSAEVKGNIAVDILVIKDGSRLIIRVPAINFRENKADFDKGLAPAVIEKNLRVLNRVAAALQRYPDYHVTVEGHANNVSGTEAEEKQDNLGPLSNSRAEAVREYLVGQGVKADKLKAAGIGGKRPVVDRRDRDNRWKNRRVEFVLER
ncbi:MAG: gliding motility-associated C-terminal domain-containing protein [Spirochaetaceae bacterium]|jgi:outer membrane protein OmpA-like peptidoglycan-associated protein|nr:gliding motility-associated C-terminal domain-containing protein [Spirochaetaceae bacterium]